MRLTVIISYYKALDNLKIILKALNNQSCSDFEVIISEDDYNEETISFLNKSNDIYTFQIIHLNQKEDQGFRKNMMLNKCLLECRTELLAFIDGDCIPNRHFVKEYIKHLEDAVFLSGRGVMLGEKISKEIVKSQALEKLNFLSLLFTDSEKIKDGIYSPFLSLSFKTKGLVGRNWGIKKKHLLEINGFDEDYIRAGVGEDADIEWRLLSNGIKRKSIKNKAFIYHIFHTKKYSEEGVMQNFEMLDSKKLSNNIRCLNGIETLENKV